MRLNIGVCGIGGFAHTFIPLFMAHPLVGEVAMAEIVPERLQEAAQRYGIRRTYPSLEAMCDSDIDAVAIIAQRHLHGPMSIQALQADKHVFCAVPIGSSREEIEQIFDLVARPD